MAKAWMRGAAVTVLGWAMLAGAAHAAVITYNFSAPISSYYDNVNGSGGSGTFAGSISVDTAKLAQFAASSYNDPTFGYTYTRSGDLALAPVTISPAVSGTPRNSFANSPLSQQPTYSQSQLFQGRGSHYLNNNGGSFFSLSFYQEFYSQLFDRDNTMTIDHDYRQLIVDFRGAATTVVDGYVLPTPGTGTINAYLNRVRQYDQYSADGDYLGGSYDQVEMNARGGTTSAGAGAAVPEPGVLALLGLGLLGVAARRRAA